MKKQRSKLVKVILRDARLAKEELDNIRFLFKTSQISYEEARERANLPLMKLNSGMVEIAKEYHRKHYQIRFSSLMR